LAESRQATRAPQENEPRTASSRTLSLAVVGISTSSTCGVRDHAALQAQALREQDVDSTDHWLQRDVQPLHRERRRMRAWVSTLASEVLDADPDAIVLHYSVFSFSHVGVPLFVRPVIAALRHTGVPLVSVLHEFAYPWRRDGVHGAVWAVSQRLALVGVLRASAGVVVTADWRERWLATRAWLPQRRIALAPVFSNLPAPSPGAAPHQEPPLVGLFGYSYERATVALVLDALAALELAGTRTQLLLIGAPGAESGIARLWLEEARLRGLAAEPGFSGRLPASELSDLLAECDVLLSAERSGPTSRKTTLAASLASGRPVVALDGPRAWRELLEADAAIAVTPTADALAAALGALLSDAQRRARLGARGREFAALTMTPRRSARVLRELVAEIVDARS
jgi:glycosyltransferase involved in cell wall biosynthesis